MPKAVSGTGKAPCFSQPFSERYRCALLDVPADSSADTFAAARERFQRPAFTSPFQQPRAVEKEEPSFISPVAVGTATPAFDKK